MSNGSGVPELDMSNGGAKSGDGTEMKINGRRFEKGIGVHADSRITYALGGKWITFTSMIGVDDTGGETGSVVFQVFADGEMVYESGVMTGKQAAKEIEVDVQGKKELWLVVTDAEDGSSRDMANWANPILA